MIIVTCLVGVVCMWLLSVGISYKLSAWQMIKNSFVLLIGSFIQTIFFIAFALWPIALLFVSGWVQIIAYVWFIFIGFSCIFLVWMAFTQWVYDMFITPNLKAAKEEADSKKSPEQLEKEKQEEQKKVAMQLLVAGKSELIGRPILPVEEASFTAMPRAFTRSDIQSAAARRAELEKKIAAFTAEHEKDEKYVAYNKLFAEREKALKTEGKKGKKNNINSGNLLR
jgi:hypothetical protein